MPSKLRTHAALAVALLALFFAIGGPSFAGNAVSHAARLLTGKQIKDNSLTTKDVRNGSLLKADFKAGQLPSGPRGPKGDKGDQGPKGDTGAPGQNGQDGTAKGYIAVPNNAPDDTIVDSPPRSKGVLAYEKQLTPTNHVTYCFDLSFTPEVAAGSTFTANNAIVTTSTPHDFGGGTEVGGCPAGLRDAKAVVYDTSAGEHGDVRFNIIFD